MTDVVIAGAGSAGVVLASRLSEDPSRSVLLIEPGPDFGAGNASQPSEILDADDATATPYDWNLDGELGALGRRSPVYAGRVVGGSSATNNVIALRGQPADYDAWPDGWSYDQVLPAFRRLERDLDFGSPPWHGDAGPVPVRRYAGPDQTPVHRAFVAAGVALGHHPVADHNRPGAVGAGPLPQNELGMVRQSTALTYLDAVRDRPNLAIRAGTVVESVIVEDGKAIGVRLTDCSTASARQVVLAAGAYGSPGILMRSGIGPGDHLRELDIPVYADLPGVGENLHDHPLLPIMFASRAPAQSPKRQVLLTTDDLQIFPSGPVDGRLVLFVALMEPRSRGRVRLSSPNAEEMPDIDVGLLTHPDDLPRLLAGVQVARELAATSPLKEHLAGELPPDRTDEELVSEQLNVYQHPVGTCRMGPAGDPAAVVDSTGRVHGVAGLAVADASIMPTIPRANTNLPAIMIGERLAELWDV